MVEVKICGIRDAAGVDAVREAGAEWLGLVFFPPSPRAVGLAEAGALAARAEGGPRPVGLFVEPSDAELAETLRHVPLAALQVHAPAERAAEIGQRFGLPVWLGVGVAAAGDLPEEAPGIARLLLDRAATAAELPGGNAQAFDWTLLRGWSPPVPWMLAGGLTPETVGAAVAATGARAVDVSSGVERGRGVKDAGLIRAFVAAAKGG